MAKTWIQHFETKKDYKLVTLTRAFGGIPIGEKMLVATPEIVAQHMLQIKKGKFLYRKDFRNTLAQSFNSYGACPLSTAIFIRIVAEAMYEKYTTGTAIKSLVPFWRVVDIKAENKYSFSLDFLAERRNEENIIIA